MSEYAGTYRVVFGGAVTGEQTLAAVKESLASEFGLSPASVDRLCDGRRHSVKRGAGWETAQALVTRLNGIGAVADVELELSPSVWHAAFEAAPAVSPSQQAPSFSFRIAGLIPLVCILPGRRSVIERSDRRPWAWLTSQRFATGIGSRWLTAFVVALLVEILLVRAIADALPWGVRVAGGLITFVGLLYAVAALLQQPRRFQGRLPIQGELGTFRLVETRTLPGLPRRFTLRTDAHAWQLRYQPRAQRLDAFDDNGTLVAQATIPDHAAGAAQDLASELRDEALPFGWLPDMLGVPLPGIAAKRLWTISDGDAHECATLVRGYRCRWFDHRDPPALPEPLAASMALVLAGA